MQTLEPPTPRGDTAPDSALIAHLTGMAAADVDNDAPGEIRVPIELHGSIWSAIVDRIETRSLRLIVDRDALPTTDPVDQATIRYQPETGAMRCATGRIRVDDPLFGHRVRLNFELA
jgi:hypothetical protein